MAPDVVAPARPLWMLLGPAFVAAIVGFGDIDENGFNTYITAEVYKRDGYTTGDLRKSFVKQWVDGKWNAAVSANPPGVMATALNVAVLMLEGNKLKDGVLKGPNGNSLYVDTYLVSNANLEKAVKDLEPKPDTDVISFTVSPDELKTLFFQ